MESSHGVLRHPSRAAGHRSSRERPLPQERLNVLVTGGTGVLGREVVDVLGSAGHRARVLSRAPAPAAQDDWAQGDIATGAGLDAAVADIDVVVHAASAAREPRDLEATDVEGTRNLLEAAARADVKHFVYVSIVGIDGLDYPYYVTKVRAESVVREGAVPWSILRATQFHSYVDVILRRFDRLPSVVALPRGALYQPVDAHEVAARLADVVVQQPAGMLPDFGGPEVRTLDSLARSWLRARRIAKRVLNVPVPFRFARQLAAGRLTCPDHKDGKITFEQYLTHRYQER